MKKIIIIFLCCVVCFFAGRAKNVRIKDWYPRISWQEFIKEQNYSGCITDIYIKNGLLEVGINGKIIHSSIIEIE